MAQGDTITVTDQGDGTYQVQISDSDSDDQSEQQPQVAKSVDEVCQIIQQELSEGADPQAAWAAEAKGRDASGLRQPGAGPQLSM